MFKLTRPCANCPFRKGQGELFGLGRQRLLEIFDAVAFPCHKTIDYAVSDDGEDTEGIYYKTGGPQQCAGLMSLLHREDKPNQIMQVGERMGYLHPTKLNHSDVYATLQECIEAHEPYVANRRARR